MLRSRINQTVCAVILAAVVVWLTTGRAVYTRFPDVRRTALAPLQLQDADLWPVEKGENSAKPSEEFPNRFMLGLLPSGGGRYALSVMTVAISVITLRIIASKRGLASRK